MLWATELAFTKFLVYEGLSQVVLMGENSPANAGARSAGLIPGMERSPGVGNASILAWKIPWAEEPVGYSPRGHRESPFFSFQPLMRSLSCETSHVHICLQNVFCYVNAYPFVFVFLAAPRSLWALNSLTRDCIHALRQWKYRVLTSWLLGNCPIL